MDIKSFGAKLSVFGEKAAIVSNNVFQKAGKLTGEMLEKTADFTFDKLKTSPLCILNGEAFDEVKGHKNFVVFVVGDRENVQSKSIVGRMPLLVAKAWQFSATLKVIYGQDLPDLVQAIGAEAPSVSIYRNGALKYMLTGEKLDAFVDTFDIFCDWDAYQPKPPATPTTTTPAPATPVVTSESSVTTPEPSTAAPASSEAPNS